MSNTVLRHIQLPPEQYNSYIKVLSLSAVVSDFFSEDPSSNPTVVFFIKSVKSKEKKGRCS